MSGALDNQGCGLCRRTIAEALLPFRMLCGLRRSPLGSVQWQAAIWYPPSIFLGPLFVHPERTTRCRKATADPARYPSRVGSGHGRSPQGTRIPLFQAGRAIPVFDGRADRCPVAVKLSAIRRRRAGPGGVSSNCTSGSTGPDSGWQHLGCAAPRLWFAPPLGPYRNMGVAQGWTSRWTRRPALAIHRNCSRFTNQLVKHEFPTSTHAPFPIAPPRHVRGSLHAALERIQHPPVWPARGLNRIADIPLASTRRCSTTTSRAKRTFISPALEMISAQNPRPDALAVFLREASPRGVSLAVGVGALRSDFDAARISGADAAGDDSPA